MSSAREPQDGGLRPTEAERRRPEPAFARVLEELGTAVCHGRLAPGEAVTLDELEVKTQASRTVVREAVRSLATMGLVEARQRVGIRALPPASWNLFDPRVIRWRLASSERAAQVRMLQEVRLAVEPEAARLAARHSAAESAGPLLDAALALSALSGRDSPDDFADADGAFHRLVLEASGNAMFVQLADVIAAALQDRATHIRTADQAAMALHLQLAQHIAAGAEDAAWHASREIILRG